MTYGTNNFTEGKGLYEQAMIDTNKGSFKAAKSKLEDAINLLKACIDTHPEARTMYKNAEGLLENVKQRI